MGHLRIYKRVSGTTKDIGPHKMMLGDCLERMKEIEAKSIDLVLADPPYGTTQNKWDTVIPFNEMWDRIERVIKPNAPVVLMAGQPFTSALVMSRPVWFKYQWVWRKSKPTGHLNAKKRPLLKHEDIVVFCKGVPTYIPQGTKPTDVLVKRTNRGCYGASSKTTRQTVTGYPTSIIDFAVEQGVHPTQKPTALMEYLIRTYTNEGDTVLDFTMGSGTTILAAHNIGRRGIGIELSEKYYEIACNRLIAGDN